MAGFVFPPPRGGGEQFDKDGYPIGDQTPGFLFPPPKNTDGNSPYEVVEQVGGRVSGLVKAARNDVVSVDTARANAENAIVENMSSSLEMMDEIQRFGGAYCRASQWSTTWGENTPDVLPLTDAFPLAAGTSFTPPADPTPPSGTYPDDFASKQAMARKSGTLNLTESGLWLIFFQAGVLQGSERITQPADVWAYVSNDGSYAPIGTPGMSYLGLTPASGNYVSRHKGTGSSSLSSMSHLAAWGRASSYVGLNNSRNGGGVTVFGCFPVYLQTANWSVTMSVQSWAKFGGASTSNVIAYKVNSESIRDSIDDLTEQIELALPGASTQLSLDEMGLEKMVEVQGWE